MKAIILFISILLYGTLFSQREINLYLGINESVDIYYKDMSFNNKMNLQIGINLQTINGSLILCGQYTYGGVVGIGRFVSLAPNFKPFDFDYHYLGGVMKYRFLKGNVFYRPSLTFGILTEVESRYRGNGLIKSQRDIPLLYPTKYIYPHFSFSQVSHGNSAKLLYYHTYNYVSTPFIGSFSFGNEFRIFEGFYIDLEIGYMLRAFRYYHNTWLPDEEPLPVPIKETHRLRNSEYGTTVLYHCFEVSLGINYSFSWMKKEK